jgi:hypothetical protein
MEIEMATNSGKKDVSEEFADKMKIQYFRNLRTRRTREKVEQEIRDTDKSIAKLTKRKAELEQLLKNPQ